MGKKRSGPPEVNAGSMADIAFLLLIFFLVTTTIETDQGINRKLPPIDNQKSDVIIKEKNILQVLVNKNDQLLVNDELLELKDLREKAVKFLDNGGDATCVYCKGSRNPESSDNPEKSIISLQNDAETSYKTYIAVQNELVAAYYELRDRECLKKFGISYREMEAIFEDPKTPEKRVTALEPKIKSVQDLYPQKVKD